MTKTTAAWVAKDLYGKLVWFPLVQEVDGVEQAAFSLMTRGWEFVPATRKADADTLHAGAVARFGAAFENPAKPLKRVERNVALSDLLDRVTAALRK